MRTRHFDETRDENAVARIDGLQRGDIAAIHAIGEPDAHEPALHQGGEQTAQRPLRQSRAEMNLMQAGRPFGP